MRDAQLGAVVRHIRRLAVPSDTQGLSDVQLLERFTRHREESAFAALMRRHGGLVWGVCRHVLRQEQDAEDAFQATFLVLADRAAAIRKREALACWLHGTAYRIAMTARRDTMRRRTREASVPERPVSAPESAWQDLQTALDEEVQRLPERHRAVFILCALEGKSQAEAAADLGWRLGTVASTLARSRARLKRALAARGIALSAVLAGLAVFGRPADAAPTALAGATLRAAVAGTGAAEVTARVAALARAATDGLSLPMKLITSLVVLAAAVGAGAAFWPAPPAPPPATPSETAAHAEETGRVPGPVADPAESPLPPGALARLGTSRFRHAYIVSAVAYSPDGKTLATGTHTGTVRFWDPATGKELRVMTAHSGGVIGLAFSPDGKTLATGSWDRSIRMWDTATGKLIRTMLGHTSEVSRLAFSPNGRVLASGGKDGTVRLWDPATGVMVSSIAAHAGEVRGIAFSPDDKRIASAGTDKFVYVWDAATGKRLVTCEGHENDVTSVAFSPDGKMLASSSKDKTARLWDAATGKARRTIKHDSWLERVEFSPDGKSLAIAGGWGAKVYLWDLTREESKPRWVGRQPFSISVAFSPDGKKLAGVGWECAVRVWDVATGKEEGAASAGGHTGWVTAVAVLPDRKTVISAGTDGAVIVWDATRGRELRRMEGHKERVHCLAVSPDGRTVASGGRDKTVRLWDVATGRELKKIEAGGLVHGLAFSPDGKRLVSTSGNDTYDGWVQEMPGHGAAVWDVATGKPLFRLEGHAGGVKTAAWSPDGKTIATGGNDKTVRLWDAATGKQLRNLEGHEGAVESVAFSPDGRRLATAGQDGVARLWRLGSDDKPMSLGTADGWLLGVAFSPDGRALVTASRQAAGLKSALHLWDVATGKERAHFAGHQGTAAAVAFSSDGRVLVSGGGDGAVFLWDVTGRVENGKFASAELLPPALESEWASLVGDDVARAHKAVWALVAAPKQSLPVLREVLKPAPAGDAAQIARLVKELDDDDFSVREKASAELEKIGETAAAALRKALEGKPSAELRIRATLLLDGFAGKGKSVDVLRRERALEVLEHIGSPEARALLEALAKGAPEATQTREAKEALERLPR